MPSNRIRGVTIEIGGDTTKLTKALADVDKQLSNTQSKLRDVDKLLKLNPGNTDLLRQKQQLLTEAIDQTKTRLDQLREAQKNATKSEDYDALQREIIETEGKLESLENEYKNFGSVQAQQLKVAGEKMQAVGKKISDIGASLTSKLTLPIAGAFTVAGKYASDYEENLNKIDVAFGNSAEQVKKWSETATKQFGLSKVAATEAASGFGALAKGIGMSEKPAAEVSTTLAGLSSDLASYFNASQEDSAKALEGIFTGEAEALKKFGVVMNDTNLEKFAEDQGKVWKECSQTEKTMIRYQFVLSKTKDAQGDYSRTSDGTANTIRTFQAALQNLATVIGQKLLPIITPMIQKAADMVDRFSKMSPQMQELIVKIGLLVAAAGPVLQVVGPIVSIMGKATGGVSKLIDKLSGGAGLTGALKLVGAKIVEVVGSLGPWGVVIAAIIAAVAALTVAVVLNWDKVKKWTKDLGKQISKTFKAIGKNIKENWEKVVSTTQKVWNSIGMVVNKGVNLVRNGVTSGMTKVHTAASTAWTKVRSVTSSAWGGIKSAVTNGVNSVRNSVSNGMAKVKTVASNAWTNVKNRTSSSWSSIKATVSGAISSVRSVASGGFTAIKTTAANAWSNLRSGAQRSFSALRSTVSNSFHGVYNAITAPLRNAYQAVRNVVSRIKNAFKFRISLPKIRLPHIRVTWLNVGKLFRIPRLSVQWYKKAYDNPMLFNSPTVLQTPYGAKGFGDGNGGELVYGHKQLMRDIAEASSGMNVTINITQQPGQDATQLANIVSRKLAQLQKQKEAVYA